MESTSDPEQYPVKKTPAAGVPGWDTERFLGSECEYLTEYLDGGLCPIHIGDVLGGQDLLDGEKRSFRVVGKLGRGSYSTVWLGKDFNLDTYVAIKVLRREHSTIDNSELSILRKLDKLRSAFFHTHTLTGNRFLCLAQKPLGSTLGERLDARISEPNDIKSLTELIRVLLMKVLDFHSKGICHGDISPNNVALGAHQEAFTEAALNETFEEDEESNVRLIYPPDPSSLPPLPAHLPRYLLRHRRSPLKTDASNMSAVDIIDFGKGFETPSKKGVLGTSYYAAPELDRDGENTATMKSDLWSLGCVFAYVASDSYDLFEGCDETWYTKECSHEAQLSLIENFLSETSFLEQEPEYRDTLAQLIHSLVRADPKERNLEEAMELVRRLEQLSGISLSTKESYEPISPVSNYSLSSIWKPHTRQAMISMKFSDLPETPNVVNSSTQMPLESHG
ncbi:hypothetical protein FQN54_006172 [Arachnomyces sp. PD_36]|nr:hypothetical protein FQN54_006172 [Arachnomyces sp. PD_36]